MNHLDDFTDVKPGWKVVVFFIAVVIIGTLAVDMVLRWLV